MTGQPRKMFDVMLLKQLSDEYREGAKIRVCALEDAVYNDGRWTGVWSISVFLRNGREFTLVVNNNKKNEAAIRQRTFISMSGLVNLLITEFECTKTVAIPIKRGSHIEIIYNEGNPKLMSEV